MARELTIEEKREILKHMQENPKMDILQVIDIFEEKWDILITETCIGNIMVSDAIGQLK